MRYSPIVMGGDPTRRDLKIYDVTYDDEPTDDVRPLVFAQNLSDKAYRWSPCNPETPNKRRLGWFRKEQTILLCDGDRIEPGHGIAFTYKEVIQPHDNADFNPIQEVEKEVCQAL